MTRIAISVEAYEALIATLPLGTVAYEPEPNAKGERLIWLSTSSMPCASPARVTATSSCGSSNWEARFKASLTMTAQGRAQRWVQGCTPSKETSYGRPRNWLNRRDSHRRDCRLAS
jgi:hypothetical protein